MLGEEFAKRCFSCFVLQMDTHHGVAFVERLDVLPPLLLVVGTEQRGKPAEETVLGGLDDPHTLRL